MVKKQARKNGGLCAGRYDSLHGGPSLTCPCPCRAAHGMICSLSTIQQFRSEFTVSHMDGWTVNKCCTPSFIFCTQTLSITSKIMGRVGLPTAHEGRWQRSTILRQVEKGGFHTPLSTDHPRHLKAMSLSLCILGAPREPIVDSPHSVSLQKSESSQNRAQQCPNSRQQQGYHKDARNVARSRDLVGCSATKSPVSI